MEQEEKILLILNRKNHKGSKNYKNQLINLNYTGAMIIMKSANTAYLTITLTLGIFICAVVFMFGNVAGADIDRAVATGDVSIIDFGRYLDPETYVKDAKKEFNVNDSSKPRELSKGEANSRYN